MENVSQETSSAPAEAFVPPSPPPRALPLAPREIWTLRDLLLFVAFLPVAFLAADVLAFTAYAALRPFTGWHAPTDLLAKSTIFGLILQSLLYLFVLGYLFLLAKLLHHQAFWKSLGWKKPNLGQILGCMVGGGLLAIVVSVAPPLLPDAKQFPLEQLFNSTAASYAIGVFAISIAPVIEEVVFRGLLFAVFERALGLRLAVACTTVLFAGLHVPEYWHAWNHMLMILIAGLVFSLARGVSGTLTPSVFLHVGYNSLIMTGIFFSTHHFRALN